MTFESTPKLLLKKNNNNDHYDDDGGHGGDDDDDGGDDDDDGGGDDDDDDVSDEERGDRKRLTPGFSTWVPKISARIARSPSSWLVQGVDQTTRLFSRTLSRPRKTEESL